MGCGVYALRRSVRRPVSDARSSIHRHQPPQITASSRSTPRSTPRRGGRSRSSPSSSTWRWRTCTCPWPMTRSSNAPAPARWTRGSTGTRWRKVTGECLCVYMYVVWMMDICVGVGVGALGDHSQPPTHLKPVDHEIGRVVQALHRTGLANDTLVFITSDNGPWDVRACACICMYVCLQATSPFSHRKHPHPHISRR